MIEDLIIIIPTHNRQNYLGRVIRYYSSFPCKVYICDSSKQRADVKTPENISYRWVPQLNFYQKVLDVVQETSAELYALAADDDFIKMETLLECVEMLKANSKYMVANGAQYLFNKEFDGRLFYNPSANGFRSVNEINNDEVGIRFYWENYQNILWSLFRREVVLNAFVKLSQTSFNNGNFVEVLLSIESLKKGVVYISKNPFNFMEVNPGDHWGNTTLPISWISYFRSKSLRQDIRMFNIIYRDDEVAKESLSLHMGNPMRVLCKYCILLVFGLVGKLGSVFRENDLKPVSLPEVDDKIMVDRIAHVCIGTA